MDDWSIAKAIGLLDGRCNEWVTLRHIQTANHSCSFSPSLELSVGFMRTQLLDVTAIVQAATSLGRKTEGEEEEVGERVGHWSCGGLKGHPIEDVLLRLHRHQEILRH